MYERLFLFLTVSKTVPVGSSFVHDSVNKNQEEILCHPDPKEKQLQMTAKVS